MKSGLSRADEGLMKVRFGGERRWWALPIVATAVVTSPLLFRPRAWIHADSYRAYDWLEAAKHRWFARHALLHDGRLPLWNPFLEGGIPGYAHPSDGTLSPFFATSLVLGEGPGMKVDVAVLAIVGALGLYLLGRAWLSLPRPAAAVGACCFGVGGWCASRVAVGFYESIWMLLTPLAMTGLLYAARNRGRRRAMLALVGCAGLLAAAGIQMQLCLVFLFVQLGLWVLVCLGDERSGNWRLPTTVLVTGLLVAGLGAIKFVPMLEFLGSRGFRIAVDPRPVGLLDGLANSVRLFETAAPLGRLGLHGVPLEPEYGYGGLTLIVGALALVAIGARTPGWWRPALLLLVTLLLGWRDGVGSQLSLFGPLHELPLLSSIRDTSRYVSFFSGMWTCLLAGSGAAWLIERARERGPRAQRLFVVLVTVGLLPQAIQTARLNHDIFDGSALELIPSVGDFRQVRLEGSPAAGTPDMAVYVYNAPRSGIGVLYPIEDLPYSGLTFHRFAWSLTDQGTVHTPPYSGEVWPERGSARVGPLIVESNRLRFWAETETPALVVVNQTWHPDWTSPDGLVLAEREGLISVQVPGGWAGAVELDFRPRALRIGAIITVATMLVCIFLVVVSRRRP